MRKLTLQLRWMVALLCLTAWISVTPARAQTGQLFESGVLSGSIHTFTSGGTEETFATGLQSPVGIAFNGSGDLFVAGNDTIDEFTPSGAKSVYATGAGAFCLAFNSQGDLFADSGNSIVEITPSGIATTFATGLDHPTSLAFNSAGDLFEADDGSGNIYEFTPSGVQSTFATGLGGPFDLAFNHAGDLFETNYFGGSIMEFAPNGSGITLATGLQNAYGLAFNSTGDLFETNYAGDGEFSIMEFTPSGAESTFAITADSGYLAFEPIPEPSAFAFIPAGLIAALFFANTKRRTRQPSPFPPPAAIGASGD